jgi:catechol 1,2-dioxygenase
MTREQIDAILNKIESTENGGNERTKLIVNRIVKDLFYMMEDLDVTPDEFWAGMSYLTQAGINGEWGLIAPGLGFEHYMDVRMDEADEKAGLTGGTPRTIEGPLYVAGAPVSHGFARMDDGQEEGKGETVFLQGQILDLENNPVPHAQVELWHANLMGFYSFFDPTDSQPAYNHRRTIITDENGRYQARTIIPNGYAVPPNGSTDVLLTALGRHGHRPAHIHYFVSKDGYRKLTTQINIEGDPYVWDDFAFATKAELIPVIERISADEAKAQFGMDRAVAVINFDLQVQKLKDGISEGVVNRAHKEA